MITPSGTNKGRWTGGLTRFRASLFQFMAVSLPIADWWKLLQQEVTKDTYYATLAESHSSQNIQWDGVWMQGGRVHLSPGSALLPAVLAEGYVSLAGGHFGFHKTLCRIIDNFVWSGLCSSVKEYIYNCDVCWRCKYDNLCPAGLLQLLLIP